MKVEEFLNITKKYIFELEKTIKEQEIKMKRDAEDIEELKAIIEELQTKEVIDSFLHNDLSNSMIEDIQDMTILIGNERIRFHKISNPSEFKRSSTLRKIVDIFKKCIVSITGKTSSKLCCIWSENDQTYENITIINKTFPTFIVDDSTKIQSKYIEISSQHKSNEIKNLELIKRSRYQSTVVKFLPVKISEIFPNIASITIKNFTISSVERENLEYLKKLEYLNLENNEIESIDGDTFDDLTELKYLNLKGNKISEINKDWFANTKNLKWISFENNLLISTVIDENYDQTTSEDEKNNEIIYKSAFDQVFSKLKYLEKVWLNINYISSIPKDIFNFNNKLQEIYLDKNMINEISQGAFDGLTELNILDISSNQLRSLDKKLFNGLNNLKVLRLNDNQLKKLNENLLKDTTSLTEFDLNTNQISQIHENSFKNTKKLKALNLGNNDLTKIEDKTFENLSELTELNLNENHLKEINPKIFNSLKNLKILRLRKNKISSILPSVFKNLKLLEEIDLSENQLTKIPSKLFDSNLNLKIVQFYRNQITTISSEIFEKNSKLIVIDLLGNDCIDDKYSRRPSPLTTEQKNELKKKIDENCEHEDEDEEKNENTENFAIIFKLSFVKILMSFLILNFLL